MSKGTILVVEDDMLIAMMTVEMIEDLGYSVLQASNGQEALDLFATGPSIDLVITDQSMPGMLGTELARNIVARWPDMPIIVATGHDKVVLPETGSFGLMQKPYTQEGLRRAIEQLFPAIS